MFQTLQTLQTLFCLLLVDWIGFMQISGETIGDVRIVADMHERKAAMAQEAEAFIALPGEFSYSKDSSKFLKVCIFK